MATLTHSEIETVWVLEGGLVTAQDEAAAIAQAESGGRTDAILNTAYPSKPNYHPPAPGNLKEYSVGLWQINMLAHPQYSEASLLTATGNAKAAVAISRSGASFTAWSTFTTTDPARSYRRFLTGPTGSTPQPGIVPTPDVPGKPVLAMHGWHELTKTLAFTVPRELHHSQQLRVSALRALGQARSIGRNG